MSSPDVPGEASATIALGGPPGQAADGTDLHGAPLAPVPEPGTIVLLLAAALGIAATCAAHGNQVCNRRCMKPNCGCWR